MTAADTAVRTPRPRSAAQIEASRSNGARSRGPLSEEGKRRSALNAARHGLRARTGAVTPTNPQDAKKLAGLRADLARRWPVATASERHWLDTLAHCHLRQAKLDALELLAMDALLLGTNEPNLPSLATLIRYRRGLAREMREACANLQAAIAARPQRQRDTDEPEGRDEAPRRVEAPSAADPEREIDALLSGMAAPGPVMPFGRRGAIDAAWCTALPRAGTAKVGAGVR